MSYTFKELKKKKINELRKIASQLEHEAVQGYTQMNKEHLLEAVCKALGLDMFEHHKAMGINKTQIKAKIKELKKKRNEAMEKGDSVALTEILHRIHVYKRKLHKATV